MGKVFLTGELHFQCEQADEPKLAEIVFLYGTQNQRRKQLFTLQVCSSHYDIEPPLSNSVLLPKGTFSLREPV